MSPRQILAICAIALVFVSLFTTVAFALPIAIICVAIGLLV